jgi:hypothetical protein
MSLHQKYEFILPIRRGSDSFSRIVEGCKTSLNADFQDGQAYASG